MVRQIRVNEQEQQKPDGKRKNRIHERLYKIDGNNERVIGTPSPSESRFAASSEKH